jgi:hypothetical protein
MQTVKNNTTTSKKGKEAPFTKKQVENISFKEKIDKANALLSLTIFLKKTPPTIH